MISESGAPRWASEDDTPTQVFGPLVVPDETELGAPLAKDEVASGPRDEHGLTALLTKDARSLVPPRTRERRTVKITAALGVLVLVVIGIATYEVVSGLGHAGRTAAAPSLAAHAATSIAATSIAATKGAAANPGSSTTPAASPSKATSPPPVVTHDETLRVVGATALGPGGKAGDNPAGAQNAVTGHGPGWQTDWYVTPVFGGLQTGTGLLLDLGAAKTISSVTVTLGSGPGAVFELRAGNTASSSLPVVATSAGPGGTVQLTLTHPAQARYLLIWFTKLPADGAGHYQAKVSLVTVRGHS